MKKVLAILLCLALLLSAVGCKSTKKKKSGKKSESETESFSDYSTSSEDTGIEEEEDDELLIESSGKRYVYDKEFVEKDAATLSAAQQRANEIIEGSYQGLFASAISGISNSSLTRLAKVIQKAKAGKHITIAFYGSENSAGTGKTSADYIFAKEFSDYISTTYRCEVTTIIAGYTSMSSVNGAVMVYDKVLKYNPDMVVLDFAVQDSYQFNSKSNDVSTYNGGTQNNALAFDGMIKQILNHNNETAIINLALTGAEMASYRMNVNTAKAIATSLRAQKDVCKYYDIPTVEFGNALWNAINTTIEVAVSGDRKVLSFADFADNNVCFNSAGHKNIAMTLEYLWESTAKKLTTVGTKIPANPKTTKNKVDKFVNVSFTNIQDIISGKNGFSAGLGANGKILSGTGLTAKYFEDTNYLYTEAKASVPKNGVYNTQTPSVDVIRSYYIEKNSYTAADSADVTAIKNVVKTLDATYFEENKLNGMTALSATVINGIRNLFAEKKVTSQYFEINIPAAYATGSSCLLFRPSDAGTVYSTSYVPHSPLSLNCYDKNGKLISTVKPQRFGAVDEADKSTLFLSVNIPANTARLEVCTFYVSGGYCELYGIGNYNTK